MTSWRKYGACSVTCGLGVQKYKRFCIGNDCGSAEKEKNEICRMPPCPKTTQICVQFKTGGRADQDGLFGFTVYNRRNVPVARFPHRYYRRGEIVQSCHDSISKVWVYNTDGDGWVGEFEIYNTDGVDFK